MTGTRQGWPAHKFYGCAARRRTASSKARAVVSTQEAFPDLTAETAAQLKLLYLSCGMDDGLLASNRQFKDWLKSRNISSVDIETPGYAHVWGYWRKSLVDVAPRLFL